MEEGPMIPQLTPIERCSEIAGLRAHEIVIGVSHCETHERMLAQYRRARSQGAARARIVADIRAAVEKGAARRAADLLIVLRRLLARDPRKKRGDAFAPCTRRKLEAPRRRNNRVRAAQDPSPAAAPGQVIVLANSRTLE
jgi:hypothetical protein